jgi:poly(A) polymerase
MSREILRRLKCSGEEIDLISEMVAAHMNFMQVPKMKTSTLRKFIGQDHFDSHLELHRLDCMSSHGKLDNYQFLQNKIAELDKIDQARLPPPMVNGKDLIAMGLSPSKLFKEVLTLCYEQQLEDAFASKDEALAWVGKYIKEFREIAVK